MATIRKRSDKYHVQFRRQGFAPVTKSFFKLADAKEWARLLEIQADRQELSPNRKALEQSTLGDLVTRYRDEVIPKLKAADRERYVVNAFLRHSICRKTLSELTVRDFVKYRDERLKTVTAKSLQRTLSPINHMFRLAVEEWDIPLRDNPLAKLRLKVIDNKRERRLKEGELDTLLAMARSGHVAGATNHSNRTRNPYVPLLIEFALETAMRRGEMLALKWAQVDIKRRSVTILEAKNGHSRVIPLSLKAVSLLEAATEVKPIDRERVFPLSPNGFLLSWSRLVARAKIDDLHFHDLRHEAISRLFELGLTVPEVASVSGHRTMGQLFRYAHANHASVRAKLLGSPGILLPKSTVNETIA
ncbi:tyrosine-type recombinase/integrase [Devosia sp. A449]